MMTLTAVVWITLYNPANIVWLCIIICCKTIGCSLIKTISDMGGVWGSKKRCVITTPYTVSSIV